MKKAFLTIACAALACAAPAEKLGDVVKAGDAAYMLVCELNSPEKNAEFQRNLNIMQSSARAIDALKAKIAGEKDAAKKSKLESDLAQIERDFKTNDETMRKAYAFSSYRKYRMMFLETNICVPLTSKNLSELVDDGGDKIDPMKIFQRGSTSFLIVKKISGINENQKLQRMIGFVAARRSEIEKLRKELVSTTDANAQMDITKRLGAGENALAEAEENLRKEYGIKSKSHYLIETAKLKLYLILTPEELAKIEAQQKAAKK